MVGFLHRAAQVDDGGTSVWTAQPAADACADERRHRCGSAFHGRARQPCQCSDSRKKAVVHRVCRRYRMRRVRADREPKIGSFQPKTEGGRMTFRCSLSLAAVGILFCFFSNAYGQVSTAGLAGAVTDESKGVLPGATITAIDLSTGRNYVAITDERGLYR